MKPIRVFALAPYQGMEKQLNQIAGELEHIDLKIRVVDLNLKEGPPQIRYEQNGGCDFIISRRETAPLAEQDARIPVVEIPLSEYDILHAIRIARESPEKFCVAGFPDQIERIQTLCNLMELNINVSVINKAAETESRIQELREQGYTLIVGDVNAVNAAKKIQLRGILIMSGKESILTALNECIKIRDAQERARTGTLFLEQILNHYPLYVFAYNRQMEMLYSNTSRTAGEDGLEALAKLLPPLVEKVFEKQEIRLLRKSGAFIWKLHGVRASGGMACFYIRRIMESGGQDSSLSLQDDFSGNSSIMQSYYLKSASMSSVIAKAKQISRSDYPVLLSGEPGTGKNTLAYAIHHQSRLQNSTFLIINCQLISEKELHNLLEKDDSPLGESDIGIHFRDIHYLSPKAQELLTAYIKETDLHRRNRVIYTYTFSFAGKEEHRLLKFLKNESECDCLTLLIPPLRERKEDIPTLANLYINEFNSNYGKQIVGLDNESLELLKEYNWPENLGQFIRAVKDLVLNTEGAYIDAEDTRAVIAKEKQQTGENINFVSLQGSLNKITADIVYQVFKEENMNQCRVAERLGISRSTVWRKLKEHHSGILTEAVPKSGGPKGP